MERLQKVLAQAGIASRRKCEEYITAGRVSIDGSVVRELGVKVDPLQSIIRVDGQRLKAEPPLYLLVNKPRGVLSSDAPEEGHPRVVDLVRGIEQRLFLVGRLDLDSEGLIILTNDGALANRLAHPRYEVPKTYAVEIDGSLAPEEIDRMQKGVHLAEGAVRFEEVRVRRAGRERSSVLVVLRHGMNREIRRVFARLGHPVRRLRRVAIGRLSDPALEPGDYRKLTPREVEVLRHDAGTVSGQRSAVSSAGGRGRTDKRSQTGPTRRTGPTSVRTPATRTRTS